MRAMAFQAKQERSQGAAVAAVFKSRLGHPVHGRHVELATVHLRQTPELQHLRLKPKTTSLQS